MKKERTLEVYLVRLDPLTKPTQVNNSALTVHRICAYFHRWHAIMVN